MASPTRSLDSSEEPVIRSEDVENNDSILEIDFEELSLGDEDASETRSHTDSLIIRPEMSGCTCIDCLEDDKINKVCDHYTHEQDANKFPDMVIRNEETGAVYYETCSCDSCWYEKEYVDRRYK
jgi:hypothetical protein